MQYSFNASYMSKGMMSCLFICLFIFFMEEVVYVNVRYMLCISHTTVTTVAAGERWHCSAEHSWHDDFMWPMPVKNHHKPEGEWYVAVEEESCTVFMCHMLAGQQRHTTRHTT